jgi:hypothetical protein
LTTARPKSGSTRAQAAAIAAATSPSSMVKA